MVHGMTRPLAAAGALVVAGMALAGCGGGSTKEGAAGAVTTVPSSTTAAPAPPTSPDPTTVTPGSTVPVGTVPAPSTASPSPTAAPPSAPQGVVAAGPVLIVRSADGSLTYDGREPRTIGYSGDATNIVNQLTWTSWGPGGAVGDGLWGYNNCEPDCAQGTVTEVPATISLGGVVGGHFTTMTEKAGTLDRSYTYPTYWATYAQ